LSDKLQNRIRFLFVDQLNHSSIAQVAFRARSCEIVWHFEPITPSAQRFLGIFRQLGLIRAEVRRVDHHIGEIRNEAGESQYVRLLDCARAICSKIKREQIGSNPLIEAMGREWATSKVVFYFVKLLEPEVQRECLRIGLVEWILQTQLGVTRAQCAVMIERKHWVSELEAHARSRGIRLVSYRQLWKLPKRSPVWSRLFRASREVFPVVMRVFRGRLRKLTAPARSDHLPGKASFERQPSNSSLAIRYGYRNLSFDPTERSEFFWPEGSSMPYSEILLYDYISSKPLDDWTLKELNARGVRLLGRGPGIPAWCPTFSIFPVLLRTLLKLTIGVLTCLTRGRPSSVYYISGLVALAAEYAYWYDFYAANRVRVNVGTVNSSVGQVLALDTLNGVSTSYQYSIYPIVYPTTLLSSGEDIQFVLSPIFEDLWRTVEAPVNGYVSTGYIYDGAIRMIRSLNRSKEGRKELHDNGASFILCFFDENSVNRWDIFASDEDATRDYEYLLQWLLSDPTLGIVFKPKQSPNLFQRIASVSGLIEEVRQTGRCKLLTSDNLVGNIYPAEAALMADVCIGKLAASTAALEARLAGCPTVLVDVEGFRNHPFYGWGRGRVVFEEWESLRVAVERYRSRPAAYPEFGDWSPALNDLDPFQDGQASMRMGLYLSWVYEALKEGASKQDALALASKQFAERWGSESVVVAGRQ